MLGCHRSHGDRCRDGSPSVDGLGSGVRLQTGHYCKKRIGGRTIHRAEHGAVRLVVGGDIAIRRFVGRLATRAIEGPALQPFGWRVDVQRPSEAVSIGLVCCDRSLRSRSPVARSAPGSMRRSSQVLRPFSAGSSAAFSPTGWRAAQFVPHRRQGLQIAA